LARFAKIGERCTKLPSMDGFPDELLLFVNISDDLKGCGYSTMFPANAIR
jgi:hypothetical protein